MNKGDAREDAKQVLADNARFIDKKKYLPAAIADAIHRAYRKGIRDGRDKEIDDNIEYMKRKEK